jgi:hypothetical protein
MLCKSLATEQKHNATAAGVASATTYAVGSSPKPPKPGPPLTRCDGSNGNETARSLAFSAERRQAGASFLQIWLSAIIASCGNSSSAAAKFPRRCPIHEVPGISRTLGARRSNQASATCIGVVPSCAATSLSTVDCSGVKPPSGNKGT